MAGFFIRRPGGSYLRGTPEDRLRTLSSAEVAGGGYGVGVYGVSPYGAFGGGAAGGLLPAIASAGRATILLSRLVRSRRISGSAAGRASVALSLVGAKVAIDSVAQAHYEVMVAWDTSHTGFFTFDSSAFNGPDTFPTGSFVVPPFNGAFDNLMRPRSASKADPGWSTRVTRMSWFRGRSDTLEDVVAGEAQVEVFDYAGLLNPKNANSPLAAFVKKPMRPCRIRARLDNDDDWTGMFYGFLRDIEYQPQQRGGIANLHFVDLFVRLDTPLTAPQQTGTTTGGAIGAILDSIGWQDPDYRALDVGDAIPLWSAGALGTMSGIEMIGQLLAAELGLVYMDGGGVAVYESRGARDLKSIPQFALTDVMRAIGPGMSADRVKNRATYTGADNIPQTYTDTASADPNTGYGLRALAPVASVYIPDATAALARAQYVVNLKKDPSGPIYNLQIDSRTRALLQVILGSEISTLLQASEENTGTFVQGFVERLEHSVDFSNMRHTANYILSERAATIFRFDSSLLDAGDVLSL